MPHSGVKNAIEFAMSDPFDSGCLWKPSINRLDRAPLLLANLYRFAILTARHKQVASGLTARFLKAQQPRHSL